MTAGSSRVGWSDAPARMSESDRYLRTTASPAPPRTAPVRTADRLAAPRRSAARQLAGLLVLAHPVRLAVLGVALAIFLLASTIAIVALVTVSVVVAALIATRLVLPAADRLDERLRFAATRGLPLAEEEAGPAPRP
jgi:hypothetical protein